MELIGEIVLYAFFFFLFIQVLFYLVVFASNLRKPKAHPPYRHGVSVIICARNEIANLKAHLPEFLSQSYSNYEVIIVNDGSTDGTVAYLEEMEIKHHNLKIVQLDIDDRFHRGKKFALTMGIKASSYEVVLLSDADCAPSSENWINEMTAPFSDDKVEIVLGLGAYERRPRSLNWAIQLDTFTTAFLYTNLARIGMPYMGVGRNLAYRKELFFRYKGFASHQHLASGDDDLFVNEAATKNNVAVVFAEEGQTVSTAHRTLGKWQKQKRRHLTTSPHYKSSNRFVLMLWWFNLFLMYAFFAASMLIYPDWKIPLIAFGSRFLLQSIILPVNLFRLNYKPYIWGYIFYDLAAMLLYLHLGLVRTFVRSKPKKWI